MADIDTYKFNPDAYKKLRVTETGRNWPVVYLLENVEEMYVGQTTNISNRLKSHLDNPKRQNLENAHVIYDEEYNISATLDIESSLIQYLAADNMFSLQNGNKGLSDHRYYDRERYQAKFDVIWKQLQEQGFAKKDLVQIKNLDLFKYSPYKALTDEQMLVVDDIKMGLQGQMNATYLINGEPGTGKSVLAVYLAKYLQQFDETKDLKVALVIPMTSLRKTLKKVFASVEGLKSTMVVGPGDVVGKEYDLIIVDEAHRLRRRVNLSGYGPFDAANKHYNLGNSGTQLDWILRASKSQVLLYDGNQSVTPGDIRDEDIQNLKTIRYSLTNQLRVLAGNDYLKFIDDVLAVRPTFKPDFREYELQYFENLNEMVQAIKKKDKEHGLARLVAGYAWTWKTKKQDSQDYDIELDGLKLKWNSANIDWVNSENAINEVGCIHTVQGYDLNYVGVIIGPELGYDPKSKKLVVYPNKYKDFNGKRSLQSPEELESYIINIYKTLLTRGIKGTYIHAVDKNLAAHLKIIFN